MDANHARALCSREQVCQRAFSHAKKLIENAATKGKRSVKIPKQPAEVAAVLRDLLEKDGFSVQLGTTLLIDRDCLVVSW